MHCCTHCPPTLQQATTKPVLHQRLPDTHRQVRGSVLWVTAPFSWVLVHKILLCPPRSICQPCVSSGSSMLGFMVTSFKRSHARTATLSVPSPEQATADPRLCQRLLDTHRQVWTISCGVTALFSWVLVHRVLLCPPRVYFPVLCKFWQLSGGVNGDLLQESLCYTQVCCTQSPCPWQTTDDPYPHRRCSNTVLSQSFWGPWALVHTRFV